MTALAPVAPGAEGYSYDDQRRDFVQVFGTDQGQRVLNQIMAMCKGPVIGPQDVEKGGYLAYRAGMEFVSTLIIKAMTGRSIPVTMDNEESN